MKKITLEEFNKALSGADGLTKELIGSTSIYDLVEKLFKENGTSVAVEDTILPIGYYLLELITADELFEELKSLGVPNINNFISNIAIELKTKENNLSISSENIGDSDAIKQSKVPNPAPNIRTMQGDIQATSQEDILKGKQEAKIDDNTPRWGNQT